MTRLTPDLIDNGDGTGSVDLKTGQVYLTWLEDQLSQSQAREKILREGLDGIKRELRYHEGDPHKDCWACVFRSLYIDPALEAAEKVRNK